MRDTAFSSVTVAKSVESAELTKTLISFVNVFVISRLSRLLDAKLKTIFVITITTLSLSLPLQKKKQSISLLLTIFEARAFFYFGAVDCDILFPESEVQK